MMDHSLTEETGKILIVDDDSLVLLALSAILEKEGYEILQAANGDEALSILRNTDPAIIICDQSMPGMSGIEIMQHVQDLYPHTIKILLTAYQDSEIVIEAINIAHVDHFLTKPWHNTELKNIVKSSMETYKLVRENELLQALIQKQHKELARSHESLQNDLKLGSRIQEQLLVGQIPPDLHHAAIDTLSVPSKEIDGDFFEFYQPDSHILDVVIGDVMGKGISAALVGTAVKTQLIRFALPTTTMRIFEKGHGWHASYLPPADIVTQVHKELTGKLIELEYFVSLFYGRFNFKHQIFHYIDCGSAKPIHYKAKEKSFSFLEGSNLPLGVEQKASYETFDVRFSEGDLFIFYSDGVTEARNSEGALFGFDRLAQLVDAYNGLQPKVLKDLICQAVFSFSQHKLYDDLTLIVLKIQQRAPFEAEPFSTSLCGDLEQLPAVRNFVKKLCLKAPGDRERLSQEGQLIADEAFCNAVKHGKLQNGKKTIKISGELREEGLQLIISDQGDAFDPSAINDPCFCGNQETGYGWHLIRELSDSLVYTQKESPESWNHLNIFKRFYIQEGKMNISHTSDQNILIIVPEGDSLDAKDAPSFKEGVINLINDTNPTGVVFDLNQLQFIDSSGLGTFLSVLRILNSRNGDLKLSRMNQPIRTMFELVKMHKIFEIFNTTDDAVRSFKHE